MDRWPISTQSRSLYSYSDRWRGNLGRCDRVSYWPKPGLSRFMVQSPLLETFVRFLTSRQGNRGAVFMTVQLSPTSPEEQLGVMSGSDILVEALARENVEIVFGYPGGGQTDFTEVIHTLTRSCFPAMPTRTLTPGSNRERGWSGGQRRGPLR